MELIALRHTNEKISNAALSEFINRFGKRIARVLGYAKHKHVDLGLEDLVSLTIAKVYDKAEQYDSTLLEIEYPDEEDRLIAWIVGIGRNEYRDFLYEKYKEQDGKQVFATDSFLNLNINKQTHFTEEENLHCHIDVKNKFDKKEKKEKLNKSMFERKKRPLRKHIYRLSPNDAIVFKSYLKSYPKNAPAGILDALSNIIGRKKNTVIQKRGRILQAVLTQFIKSLSPEEITELCHHHNVEVISFPEKKRAQNLLIKTLVKKIVELFRWEKKKIQKDKSEKKKQKATLKKGGRWK
jgi:DNA-directed RNA polymerase specialized sigma24 family protein